MFITALFVARLSNNLHIQEPDPHRPRLTLPKLPFPMARRIWKWSKVTRKNRGMPGEVARGPGATKAAGCPSRSVVGVVVALARG